MDHSQRLQRAQQALIGLSVGDAFGQPYEYVSLVLRTKELPEDIKNRQLSDRMWYWTDDTNMAASIVRILRLHQTIHADELAQDFARRIEPKRGYGSGAWDILTHIKEGGDWLTYASQLFDGTGSYGNGAAMRAAPIGAYFADDLPEVIEQAERVSKITHTHIEGKVGGITVAVATALAIRYRQANTQPTRQQFIDDLLEHVPPSVVRDKLVLARDKDTDDAREVARELGSGYDISAQDTVPFAIWCAATWLDNYEEALWQALSGLGDTDTVCAIVGGIVVNFTGVEGIPDTWLQKREPLPDWI